MAYDILNTFKNWADRTFGSCFHAAKALDVDHSGILVFNEFRELVCAVSCYIDRNPFTALSAKVEGLLANHLLAS